MTNLKYQMNEQGISTCALACISGVHYSNVSCYASGVSRPNYSTACKLAVALKTTVEELYPKQKLRGMPHNTHIIQGG